MGNDEELAPGRIIAGKFRLDRVIGRGGMGSVWAARQVALDMPVALKFMEQVSDESLVRFEREAKATATLRSPHVVQLLDHGIDDGLPFIAMELLEGEDLGERLRRVHRITVPAMAKILVQAAKALKRAHEAGIIHRDLKPGNVFLASFDEDEIVKLLDFGVAKMRNDAAVMSSDQTQTGIVFGSPSYMSPEQARGVRVLDHRTDLWSLAVIAYRAVTGVKPFVGDSIGDLVIKLCIDPLPRATLVNPQLPSAMDTFFDKAFSRDPDQRYQSAPAMAAAFAEIEGVEGNASVSASGDSISLPRHFVFPSHPPSHGGANASREGTSGAYSVPPTTTYAIPSVPELGNETKTFAASAPSMDTVQAAPVFAPHPPPSSSSQPIALPPPQPPPRIAGFDPQAPFIEPPPTLSPHVDATRRNLIEQARRAAQTKPTSQAALVAAAIGGLAVAMVFAIVLTIVRRHQAAAVVEADPAPHQVSASPVASGGASSPAVETSAPAAPAASVAATADPTAAPSETATASAQVEAPVAPEPPATTAAPVAPHVEAPVVEKPKPKPTATSKASADPFGQKKPRRPNFGY